MPPGLSLSFISLSLDNLQDIYKLYGLILSHLRHHKFFHIQPLSCLLTSMCLDEILYVIVLNPTCLVRCDVDQGIK